jgi:hypothetical protein
MVMELPAHAMMAYTGCIGSIINPSTIMELVGITLRSHYSSETTPIQTEFETGFVPQPERFLENIFAQAGFEHQTVAY